MQNSMEGDMFDAGGWNKYKEIPAWKVFIISSNVGMGKFADKAYKHDHTKFYKRLKQYHLTEKTEVSIKGEPEPLINNPAEYEWSNLSAPWISTGYEIELTPLQTLTFYNAIANGGKMVKPQLVTKVIDHGNVVKEFKTKSVREKTSVQTKQLSKSLI